MNFDLAEELKKLPNKPGVYIMHDDSDRIIYIGKAVSLTKRVHQYFQNSHHEGIKKDQMVAHIAYFEYIVTDTELEALVLECNLIKEHRPKYNTMLTDDKTYPYIKVTLGEDFPRVLFSRILKKDKSAYYGPYTSAGAVKNTIELLHKLYNIRTCNRSLPATIGADRACLNYHIHRCMAPCQGLVTKEEYKKQIDGVLDFLGGKYKPVLDMLKEKMTVASEDMDFEKAAEYRDLLSDVTQIAQKQKITHADGEDRDIIGMARDDEDAVIQIFFIREGRMIGRDHFFVSAFSDDDSEIIQSFVKQFYSGTPYIPKEIMLCGDIEDRVVIEEWLSEKKESRVYVKTPQRGTKEKLVELATKNAQITLSQDKERTKQEEGRTIGALKELVSIIGLDKRRIVRLEAYDISNISGFESVGSMVVYEHGRPARGDYRKFKLRTVTGPDDYASMKEVLTRRFEHGLEELRQIKESGQSIDDKAYGKFSKLPDLILMDGGRGQVNICLEVLSELGLDIPVCGMVKDDHHRTRGLYFNNVELPIDTHSESFRLITRIQDEAHRFAIEFHRSLRSKKQVHSVLDDIEGIGPTRRKALMRKFQSLEAISQASVEELTLTESMNEKSAHCVWEYFHKSE